MVTHVTEISTPPTPADPPAEFEQKAALVWSELHQAVPQMNQQADEIEQIGVDAQAAKERAIQESDAALGYRNETRAARDAALPAAVTATEMAALSVTAKEQTEEFRDEAQAAAASAANRVVTPAQHCCPKVAMRSGQPLAAFLLAPLSYVAVRKSLLTTS